MNVPDQFQQCVREMIATCVKTGMTRFHGFLKIKHGTFWLQDDGDEVECIWDNKSPSHVELRFTSKRKASVAGLVAMPVESLAIEATVAAQG